MHPFGCRLQPTLVDFLSPEAKIAHLGASGLRLSRTKNSGMISKFDSNTTI